MPPGRRRSPAASWGTRVGTSGWIYGHWRKRFYPADLPQRQWLDFYSRHFDTVEINNTFYRLPGPETFEAWRRQAPGGFLFTVKASRFLTHMKKLKDPLEPVERLMTRARRLGPCLGPILYQLPPRWRKDLGRLRDFCGCLPRDLVHVMEFREPGWLSDDVFQTLADHGVSLCVHDMLKRHPRIVTGPLVYVRFHGAGRRYGGSYSRDRLSRWARWIAPAARGAGAAFVYFNNDHNAYAVRNARVMRKLLADA